jgi:hypothetical protein
MTMSLAELYREQFGEPEGLDKTAADTALENALNSLNEEEAEKLAQVIAVIEEEGLEFDHDLQKLAAAAQIVDEYAAHTETEKTAAAEIDAGGRLFARAMVDELNKLAADGEEKAEEPAKKEEAEEEAEEETEEKTEEKPTFEGNVSLVEKLFGKSEE